MHNPLALCLLVLAGVATPSCGSGAESREVHVERDADAGGVEIKATSRLLRDSIRIATEITNTLDTPADLILDGGCPVTVIAYQGDRLLWDEMDGRTCQDTEMPVPLAPGEVEMLSHTISDAALRDLGDRKGYRIGIRVSLAQGPTYMVEAPNRE